VDKFIEMVEKHPSMWHRQATQSLRDFCTTVFSNPDTFPLNAPHEAVEYSQSKSEEPDRSVLQKGLLARNLADKVDFEKNTPIYDQPVVQVITVSCSKHSYHDQIFLQYTLDVIDGDNMVVTVKANTSFLHRSVGSLKSGTVIQLHSFVPIYFH